MSRRRDMGDAVSVWLLGGVCVVAWWCVLLET